MGQKTGQSISRRFCYRKGHALTLELYPYRTFPPNFPSFCLANFLLKFHRRCKMCLYKICSYYFLIALSSNNSATYVSFLTYRNYFEGDPYRTVPRTFHISVCFIYFNFVLKFCRRYRMCQ